MAIEVTVMQCGHLEWREVDQRDVVNGFVPCYLCWRTTGDLPTPDPMDLALRHWEKRNASK